MLTKNFYRAFISLLTDVVSSDYVNKDGVVCSAGSAIIVGSSGSTSNAGMKYAMGYVRNATADKYGVFFGSGTTPATVDDYKLEEMVSKFTSADGKVVVNKTAEYVELTVTHGITATADIVISEIGLFGYSSSTTIMLDHTVLETPITIPAGQSKQITYTIRMNYPTA